MLVKTEKPGKSKFDMDIDDEIWENSVKLPDLIEDLGDPVKTKTNDREDEAVSRHRRLTKLDITLKDELSSHLLHLPKQTVMTMKRILKNKILFLLDQDLLKMKILTLTIYSCVHLVYG